jgi:hypothetical protein
VKDQSLGVQIAIVIVVAAILVAIHPGLVPVTSPAWLLEEIPVTELLDAPTRSAGALLGAGIGMALESRLLHYDWRGAWRRRGVRFLIGMLGGVALYVLSGMLLGGIHAALATGLVRFALLGFWVTYGAPWVFVKTRMAGQAARGDPYAEQ